MSTSDSSDSRASASSGPADSSTEWWAVSNDRVEERTRLHTLPPELIWLVAGYLDAVDLVNLSRVCWCLDPAAYAKHARRRELSPHEVVRIASKPLWEVEMCLVARFGFVTPREMLLKAATAVRFCNCIRCLREPYHRLAGRGIPSDAIDGVHYDFDTFAFGYTRDGKLPCFIMLPSGPYSWFMRELQIVVHRSSPCDCNHCTYAAADEYYRNTARPALITYAYEWRARVFDPAKLEVFTKRALEHTADFSDVEQAAPMSSLLALEIAASCGIVGRAAELITRKRWVDEMSCESSLALYGGRDPADAALASPLGPLELPPGDWGYLIRNILLSLSLERRTCLAVYLNVRMRPDALQSYSYLQGKRDAAWADRYEKYDALAPLLARYEASDLLDWQLLQGPADVLSGLDRDVSIPPHVLNQNCLVSSLLVIEEPNAGPPAP